MRIGIEAQRIFRKKKHGMDIYALELIRQLQKIDQINEYFIFIKPGEDVCLEETQNFKIVLVKGITYMDWEQIALPLAVSEYNLDVLHCTSNTAPLFAGVPTIITLHDIIYLNRQFSGGSVYQRLGHYYRKWVVPVAFRKASKVMTVSNFEKTHIDEYFGETGKVDVVYNGVSSRFTRPSDASLCAIREHLMLPDRYLLFLGNTAPKKNMLGVLKAYAAYRQTADQPLPLVIAESSTMDVMKMLEEVEEPDLIQHLHMTGYVDHSMLPALYALADTFLYPSLRESFGIPIIEAMACGTPVITSNTSSMPEVAGGCALLCNPHDYVELAEKILEITESNRLERWRLIQKGLERAAQFTWMTTAREQVNVYRGTQVKYFSVTV